MVTRVFVDTSALVALVDADDPRQGSVHAAFAELAQDELITHGYVVAETLAVTRRRLGVDGVMVMLDEILPAIEVVAVDRTVHAAAQQAYRDSLPSGTSFVDEVSLIVMQREGIGTALALDPDLGAPGVALLPTQPIRSR